MTPRIFLLSPANCGGTRARQLLAPTSRAELASQLRSPEGAPIGEVFAFVSGLYFRGKLTYARRFARPPEPDHEVIGSGIHVITPNAGLCSPERPLLAAELARLSGDLIARDNPAFTVPLARTARTLSREIGSECEVVLLGSIASPKYVDVLLEVFADQLRFPLAFVGRGDMSRGGLLLRQADAGIELEYGLVRGAVRNGVRPPKLDPLTRPRGPAHPRTTGDRT